MVYLLMGSETLNRLSGSDHVKTPSNIYDEGFCKNSRILTKWSNLNRAIREKRTKNLKFFY